MVIFGPFLYFFGNFFRVFGGGFFLFFSRNFFVFSGFSTRPTGSQEKDSKFRTELPEERLQQTADLKHLFNKANDSK